MKIISVEPLAIPDVKVIRYKRYGDERGYFTETFRRQEFDENPTLSFLKGQQFIQSNESHSKRNVIRGLHFQFNPFMGKLVRPLSGRLIDLSLDIRPDSPTFGKIITYDMPFDESAEYGEWIWVPVGFAHGVLFPEESRIEYFCTGSWNPECEVTISPVAQDLDWTLCDPDLKKTYDKIVASGPGIAEKDRNSLSIGEWGKDSRASHFR